MCCPNIVSLKQKNRIVNTFLRVFGSFFREILFGFPYTACYGFVPYDLTRPDWERLPEVFREGLTRSLSGAGFPSEAADLLIAP